MLAADEVLGAGRVPQAGGLPARASLASSVVLARKPDGTWHFCQDYRRGLNASTQRSVEPLLHVRVQCTQSTVTSSESSSTVGSQCSLAPCVVFYSETIMILSPDVLQCRAAGPRLQRSGSQGPPGLRALAQALASGASVCVTAWAGLTLVSLAV